MTTPSKRVRRQGFASMSPDQHRAIASRGGMAAREKAHRWTPEEARQSGRKSGEVRRLQKQEATKEVNRGKEEAEQQ